MRLRRIVLRRFRQFIDETLDVDPYVTVIVGRNDAGKTGVLRQLFDQYVFNDVSYGRDRPELVPGYEGEPVTFSLDWSLASSDYEVFPLEEAFGQRGAQE